MNLVIDSSDDVDETTPPTMFERELTEAMSFEDTGLNLEELPQPTLWRVLVLPRQPKKMSKGGIALPETAQEAETHLNYIGQVLALGPLAGKSEKFQNPEWMPPRDRADTAQRYASALTEIARFGHELPKAPRFLWDVKVGDWVLFGRYSGMVITYKGVRLLNLNDDDITEILPHGPEHLKVWV